MDDQLRERVACIIDEGAAEQIGSQHFVPIVTLDSETRFGFDAEGRWVACRPGAGQLAAFDEGEAKTFHEAVETPRRDFEGLVERGASARGLPVEAVVLSFPAVSLVATLLQARSPHIIRLALMWLLPSELREMRSQIVAIANNPDVPRSLRELAERLVVTE